MNVDSLIEQTNEGWWAPRGDRKLDATKFFKRLEGEDQAFIALIRTHIVPGSVAIDIGANIGDHTIGYMEEVGPGGFVIAYEPHPLVFECLKRNLPQVMMFNTALGDKVGMTGLLLQTGDDQGSSYLSDRPEAVPVKITTLDVHLASIPVPGVPLKGKRISLIKIDAEGSDLDILKGASQTIAKHRPVLVVEVNREYLKMRGYATRDILRWIESNNYTYSFFGPDTWDEVSTNVICLPR
jgi:FkbM family methyltransferase